MDTRKDLTDLRSSDTFDSREIMARINQLKNTKDTDEREELATLQAFAAEAEGYASDWRYGETFIRDSFFEDYARELADDIGAVDQTASWPMTYIDWQAAAEALQMDYSSIELDGVTFWTR